MARFCSLISRNLIARNIECSCVHLLVWSLVARSNGIDLDIGSATITLSDAFAVSQSTALVTLLVLSLKTICSNLITLHGRSLSHFNFEAAQDVHA